MLIIPIKALAVNLDYLDNSTWNNNPNVTSMSVSGKSGVNKLQGVFRYFFDSDDACIYTYFNVNETTLSEYNDIVKVHYDIYSESNSYSFAIDEQGICDCGDEEYKYFDVYQNFELLNGDTQRCMSVTALNCTPDLYTVDVRLYINGRNYIIKKGLEIDTRVPETTKETTTHQTTTRQATTKASKQTTTKITTTRQSSSSSNSNSKYKATGEYDKNVDDYINADSNEIIEQDDVSTTSRVTLSRASKILLIIGIIVGVVGIGFIFYSAIKSKKQNDNKEETN